MAAKKKPTTPSKPAKKKSAKSSADVELAAARATIKKLKDTVATLEKNVAKLEKKVTELKADAKKRQAAAKKSVKKAKDSGTAKAKSAKKVVEDAVEAVVHHDAPAAKPAVKTEVVAIDEAPAAELTVAQLRAAARLQGVPGYSRMRKDQLIAALR